MADLSYGGGGGGGSYYPPSFDPNNPMGSSGGGGLAIDPAASAAFVASDAYLYSATKMYADAGFTIDYFNQNINTANPYTPSYSFNLHTSMPLWGKIQSSGNQYVVTWSGNSVLSVTVYNNAYTDFENKISGVQNDFYSTETALHNAAVDKGENDLIASYGSASVKPEFKTDIATLADLNSKVAELQFQDDITRYLNRVPDSSNINTINDLKNQIAALQNSLSDRLMDYWRQQEVIRKKENEFFTWDFAWLSDPFFGNGAGNNLYQAYLQEQQFISNNIAMISDGSIYDWLAGGIYLNAVMPGGEMSAGYMPNDYYSVGLQYQVPGTNINEGGANAFPWDSMAGGASFGLNSSSRAAYKVLEL